MAFHVEGLSAGFGETKVLSQIDLDLPARGVSVLLGPGGSGKSTLLRILAGSRESTLDAEIPPHADRRLPGELWRSGLVEQMGGELGLMAQTPSLRSAPLGEVVSASEVATAGGEALIAEVWRDETLVREAFDLWWSTPFDRLPRGVEQLTSLTLTIGSDASILLLDEPTSDQDDELVNAVTRRLRKLRDEGKTLVVVTHNLRVCRAVADYVALVIGGRVVEAGDADAVFQAPKNPRAEYFLRMGC